MWSSDLDSSINPRGGFLESFNKTDGTKERKKQTIVPAMIGNLLSFSSTDEPKLWEIPARMFMIVGLVRNVEETTTKISYDIEDETGTITALKWLEMDKKTSDTTMQINTYVRVVGFLREQTDKRHILILRMWPLQTLNELINHILEVTYVTLKARMMAKDVTTLEKEQDNKNDLNGEAAYYGMSEAQTLVYKIIHAQNDTESGIERDKIKEKVPNSLSGQVDEILDFLSSEGHIYTTSSDDYFKTT
ncbi:replication protein A 32 kDa subunit-like [Bombus vosnesenskii]|uniref:Replication protein A 32 kDa subunit-like n=1 Tax=Bombus vosnesenskii TaxID=207650 RepID=A0A6J3JSR8_9HYME|nr:replication protein A 32 kDa subunit-like [Bombus vosnesenskii]